MKICFLGDGGSVHIIRWLEYFVNNNYEVHLITFGDTDRLKDLNRKLNFHLHKIGKFMIGSGGGNWKYLLYLIRIKQLLKKIQPDVINAHYVTSYGFLASLLGGRNVVLSAWGSDILVTPNKNFIYNYITRFALNHCDLITSDSEFMTSIIKKYTNRKVITVPMGVDRALCNLERKGCRDQIVILSARTVDKNCNIDCIVKAFSKFSIQYANSKLVITNSGPEINNIKNLIEKFNLNDKVELLGFVTRSKLIELLLKSDVYVSIPYSDSTSVTLLESMACGMLPIVSKLPANCEWITDGYNGLIVETVNETLVYESLLRAVQDKELEKRCHTENRRIIEQRAIWENNMSTVENEYLKLIV